MLYRSIIILQLMPRWPAISSQRLITLVCCSLVVTDPDGRSCLDSWIERRYLETSTMSKRTGVKGVAGMPRPQAAAAANLLLYRCFHGNDGEVLPCSEVKWWCTQGGGRGLEGGAGGGCGEKRGTVGKKGCQGRKKRGREVEEGTLLLWMKQREHEEAKCTRLLASSAGASVRLKHLSVVYNMDAHV